MKGVAFYEAAAQIIPLLLIVLAFQAQSFAPDRLRPWAYWIAVLAFTGETAALSVLYAEDAGFLSAPLVALTLLVLFSLTFLAIVLAPSGAFLSIRPPRAPRSRD